jgi:hypothetical protein
MLEFSAGASPLRPIPADAASRHSAWLPSAAVASALLVWAAAARADAPSAVEQARAAVVQERDLQVQLPAGEADDSEMQMVSFRLPRELWWVLVVGGVLVGLYHLRDIFPGWRSSADRDGPGGPADAAGIAAQAPADILLAADELARDGRFVEAMHALLLKGLADIRQRLGEPFADSMTSREILRRARLSAAGRNALQEIVHRVEWTYFGEHPAGQADYDACRRRFDELAAALAVAGPA